MMSIIFPALMYCRTLQRTPNCLVPLTEIAKTFNVNSPPQYLALTKALSCSPSELCKLAGLQSLARVAELTGKPSATLINWYRDQPALFDIVLYGVIYAETMPEVRHG